MLDFLKRFAHSCWLVLIGIRVFGAWFRLWCATAKAYREEQAIAIAQHGQFGDVFGSLNAVFASLALIGLVYTAMLQQNELNEQRKEIAAHAQRAQEDREARLVQSGQQYLTARLDATVALAQAHDAY
jgi:hypothetical protein